MGRGCNSTPTPPIQTCITLGVVLIHKSKPRRLTLHANITFCCHHPVNLYGGTRTPVLNYLCFKKCTNNLNIPFSMPRDNLIKKFTRSATPLWSIKADLRLRNPSLEDRSHITTQLNYWPCKTHIHYFARVPHAIIDINQLKLLKCQLLLKIKIRWVLFLTAELLLITFISKFIRFIPLTIS